MLIFQTSSIQSSAHYRKAFMGKITSQIRRAAFLNVYSENESILDICCGTGLLLSQNQSFNHGNQYVGLDISKSLLCIAKEQFSNLKIHNAHLIAGNAFFTPLRSNSFHKIFCLNTIINFKSEQQIHQLFNEVARTCKDNGYFIFDIRNASNPLLRLLYWWHNRRNTFPVNAHTPKRFLKLCAQYLLEVEKIIIIGPRLKWFRWGYIFVVRKNESKS